MIFIYPMISHIIEPFIKKIKEFFNLNRKENERSEVDLIDNEYNIDDI